MFHTLHGVGRRYLIYGSVETPDSSWNVSTNETTGQELSPTVNSCGSREVIKEAPYSSERTEYHFYIAATLEKDF